MKSMSVDFIASQFYYITIFVALFSGNLLAQDQVYKSNFLLEQKINVGTEMLDGTILLAGSDEDTVTGVLTSAVYIFDPVSNSVSPYQFLEDRPEELINSNINELKQAKNGDVVLVYNPYFQLEDRLNTDGTYGVMRLKGDYSSEEHILFQRKAFRSIFVNHIILLSENTTDSFMIVGAQRSNYTSADFWYLAEIEGNKITNERSSEGDISSYYFSKSAFKVDSTFHLFGFAGLSGSSRHFTSQKTANGGFDFRLSEYVSLPYSTVSSTRGDGFPQFSNGLDDIHIASDSLWVASSFYDRSWVQVLAPKRDTASLGMYYFTPELDSLKFVDLTTEYITGTDDVGLKSHYSDSKMSKDSSKFCFTGVFNQRLNTDRPPSGFSSGVIAMLDDTGRVLWNYNIAEEETHIRLTTAVATSDGGCVLAGDYFKEGETQGRDIIVVKMDSLGTLTSISDENLAHLFDKQKISIYPNPAQNQGKVNLSWSSMEKQNWKVKLYDKQGRIVHETGVLQGVSETNLQLPELPSGNYIIRAEGSGKQVHTGKLVIN